MDFGEDGFGAGEIKDKVKNGEEKAEIRWICGGYFDNELAFGEENAEIIDLCEE